jgi:hypothetical protein
MSSNALVPVVDMSKSQYGYYVAKSHLCPVCNKKNHMEINLLRARDHFTYDQISSQLQLPGVNPQALDKHFQNHFILYPTQRKILELKQDGSDESLAIVNKIFEGDIDIFSASQSILESKAKRLHLVSRRLEFLNSHIEIDSADDIDKQEFIQLNRVAGDIEDSMERVYSVMDKKLFPATKDELSSAILQYKLNILSKIIDSVQLVLLELERDPQYTTTIIKIRDELAKRIGNVEDEILKSGGIISKQ